MDVLAHRWTLININKGLVAKILVRSSEMLCIVIIKKYVYRIKVSKNHDLMLGKVSRINMRCWRNEGVSIYSRATLVKLGL